MTYVEDQIGPLTGMGALITGGGGGIGSAAARSLIHDGAAVMLMGRTEETLTAAVDELSGAARFGGTVRYAVGDTLVRGDLERAVEKSMAVTGRLNICVPTVGGGAGGIAPILGLQEERFSEILTRNLLSAFMAIKYTAPAISRSGGGAIVLISSIVARMPWPYQAALSSAKAGLEALVRVAADELGPLGVRINAVRPGLTRTARAAAGSSFQPEMLGRFVEQMPLGRPGDPAEVAAAIRFLAGPESSWITGQSVAVDGGHELRRAPDYEQLAREQVGDSVVDTYLRGEAPAAQDKKHA
jgi:NAD(P)-dependent dehydrogenase (short-subunit alcohol dehydrogenase family)